MAKIAIKGLEEYSLRIAKLGSQSEEITKRATYEGAKVAADAIKDGLKGLKIQEGTNGLPKVGTSEEQLTGISRKQKGDLLDSFGLAPIENKDGYIQTKAGFDGYGSVKTKKYPNGVPNQMLMRSIESGTSFRKKNPVIRKAVTKSKKNSIQAMGEAIEKACKEIF